VFIGLPCPKNTAGSGTLQRHRHTSYEDRTADLVFAFSSTISAVLAFQGVTGFQA